MASWIDLLLQILCEMYKEWGGDCADLYRTPSGAPALVVATYQSQGAPKFSSAQDLATFLSYLVELEECLKSPDNSLPTEDTIALTSLISSLRKDLVP